MEDNLHFEIGDNVYCVDNLGVEQELELGQKYTIGQVWDNDTERVIFRLVETESRWMRWRFTKDKDNHPPSERVILHRANEAGAKFGI
jgi:hypothetical protein